MKIHRRFAARAATFWVVLWLSPPLLAQDPGAYRGFRLGMTIPEVAAEAGVPVGTATVAFERPLLIQEVEWRPTTGVSPGSPELDSVGRVLFGFSNGQLYRIVVRYEPDRTEGLTSQDLIDALSAEYGPAHRPVAANIITSPAVQRYADTDPVVARWEDARSSINLFKESYRSSFGLVIYAKAVAPQVRAAIDEAQRLSDLDAPRRYLEEEKTREDAESALHAKARARNKAAFRF